VEAALGAQAGQDRVTRRGYLSQARRREVEGEARKRAVEHLRFAVIAGGKQGETAVGLGLSPRTLRSWDELERTGRLLGRRRGRPLKRSGVEARNEVIRAIAEHGPQIGVRTLRSLFPRLARGEIKDLLERYRAQYAREHARLLWALDWTTPGVVWAMDHTEPPSPVDGESRAVLSLRDLSSGAQLLWKEELGPRASEVAKHLEGAFETHGAPLVVKVDNGSAFIAEEFQEACRRWGVELLWSPPRMPRYNGAIEAAIRWLKERTEHVALKAGRPGQWIAEDLQVALALTNRLPKDGEKDPTARGAVFENRAPILDELRAAFQTRLSEERASERRERGLRPEAELSRREWAEVDRKAMCRALVALGFLNITTRRGPLPLKSSPLSLLSGPAAPGDRLPFLAVLMKLTFAAFSRSFLLLDVVERDNGSREVLPAWLAELDALVHILRDFE
jgi:transposase InsO family protein